METMAAPVKVVQAPNRRSTECSAEYATALLEAPILLHWKRLNKFANDFSNANSVETLEVSTNILNLLEKRSNQWKFVEATERKHEFFYVSCKSSMYMVKTDQLHLVHTTSNIPS